MLGLNGESITAVQSSTFDRKSSDAFHIKLLSDREIGADTCIGFLGAKKRLGLSVLDYMVTSNHVHLLVKDTGPDVSAR